MWCSAVGFIVMLTLSLLAAPLAAKAQQAGKVPRLGVFAPASPPSPEESNIAAFRQALQKLGYVEGQTVAIEYRYGLGRWERFPDLVAELVGLQVDILVVGSSPAAVGTKHATQAIPIVFLGGGDPVRSGLVASLVRPGGNLTGFFFPFIEGFGGKWVEILVDARGFMSYGIRIADGWWRAATYVDKIRKGAKPADLFVGQPMQFELVINLKTAQALGLPIPPTLRFQADKVLQ